MQSSDFSSQYPKAVSDLTLWLGRATRIQTRQRNSKNKLYALHAPEVECIGKGKAKKPYEFGVKSAVVVSHEHGLMLGARTFPLKFDTSEWIFLHPQPMGQWNQQVARVSLSKFEKLVVARFIAKVVFYVEFRGTLTAMFIKVTQSGQRRYAQLVESFRNADGKPRQRTVCTLGRLEDGGEVDTLIASLQRARGIAPVPSPLEGFRFTGSRHAGDVWALSLKFDTSCT